MNTKLKTGLAAAASAALLGATATASAAEYANVVSATPITNSVAVPRQDCVQGEQVVWVTKTAHPLLDHTGCIIAFKLD